MVPPMAPLARRIAHYFYSDGNELAIFVYRRKVFILDAKTGEYPVCPVRHVRHPHPDEGRGPADFSYETMGLYYGYEMRDTGWGGDC